MAALDRLGAVVELSRVLGEAHYLRVLCGGRGDQRWRLQMQRMIDLEASRSGRTRAAMVEAFNDGFRTGEERYFDCSSGAQARELQLHVAGARLSGALAAPAREQ